MEYVQQHALNRCQTADHEKCGESLTELHYSVMSCNELKKKKTEAAGKCRHWESTTITKIFIA